MSSHEDLSQSVAAWIRHDIETLIEEFEAIDKEEEQERKIARIINQIEGAE